MSTPKGAEVLGRATQHLREAAQNLEPIEVPEWGATLYFRPAVSVAILQADLRAYDEAPDHQVAALELTRNVLDAEGQPLFDSGDVAAIVNETSAHVVGRILDHIRDRRREVPSVEDALGNSDGIPRPLLSSV